MTKIYTVRIYFINLKTSITGAEDFRVEDVGNEVNAEIEALMRFWKKYDPARINYTGADVIKVA